MKNLVLFLTGIFFGLVATIAPEKPSVAPVAIHTFSPLDVPTTEVAAETQGEKVVSKREYRIRIYAEDGSWFEPNETEFIDSRIGEPIEPREWRQGP